MTVVSEALHAESMRDHHTMSHAEGSVVFHVQSKRFKIPRALLVMHSDAFGGMVDLQDDSNDPVVLHDSAYDFAAFCDAIVMPFTSCLLQPKPKLGEVLGVLSLSRKYCAAELEERAKAVAIHLARDPEVLQTKHLAHDLSATRVAEVAAGALCDVLLKSAWNVIMKEFRLRERNIHEVLTLADQVCGPDLRSGAYYEAMLRGHGVWGDDPRISDAQKRSLSHGALACADALDALIHEWYPFGATLAPHRHCRHGHDWVCHYDFPKQFLVECAKSTIPSYDIVGRLELASNLPYPDGYNYPHHNRGDDLGCHSTGRRAAEEQLQAHRALLPKYFQLIPDPEPVKTPLETYLDLTHLDDTLLSSPP